MLTAPAAHLPALSQDAGGETGCPSIPGRWDSSVRGAPILTDKPPTKLVPSGAPEKAAGRKGVGYTPPMGTLSIPPDQASLWVEKALRRLEECEEETFDLAIRMSTGRRRKLQARVDRLSSLLDELRVLAGKDPRRIPPSPAHRKEIAAELEIMRQEIRNAAAFLVTVRDRWNDLLRAYADAGGSPDEFRFAPPPEGSSEDERAFHGLVRKLEL